MLYPYKIRVTDPGLERILRRISHDRTVTINGNKNSVRKLGYKIRPIRKDIFIGYDYSTGESNISLKNPFLHLELEKTKTKKTKSKNFIFKM